MKKVLLVVAQFLLLLVVFAGGTLLDPFHLRWFVSHPAPISTRFFVPDGLILMGVLTLLILAFETASRRLRAGRLLTACAFGLALVAGLAMKLGWATHDLF